MPLSGAAIISENTAAASSNRCTGSLFFASMGVRAKVVTKNSLIFHLSESPELNEQGPGTTTSCLHKLCQISLDDIGPNDHGFSNPFGRQIRAPRACAITPNHRIARV